MKRMLPHRRWLLVCATTGFAVAGVLSVADRAAAQQGTMQVLIPDLVHERDAPRNFGRNVARELRKLIDELPGLRVLEGRALNDALRPFNLREGDLDCTTGRQFALQSGLDVLMCGEVGEVEGGVEVKARFILVDSGESLPLEPFVQPDDRRREQAAAQRIVSEFNDYNQMVRAAQICADYADSGDFRSALRNCNEALAINQDFPSALYGRGRALMELDQPEEALETLEHLLSINENHQDGILAAGIVATRLNRRNVSRDYFGRYLQLNPGSVEVRLEIAYRVNEEGDPEGALRIVEEGLGHSPDNVTLMEYTGHYASAAAEEVERARGASGQQDERPPEALAFYQTAVDQYTRVFERKGGETDANMLQRMILGLVRLERYQDAVELGEQVVTAKDDQPALWFTYADALQRTGRVDEALAALDRTEQLNPEYPNLHVRRGTWLLDRGRLAEARNALETAARMGTESDAIARNIFVFGYNRHYQNDNLDTALEYFALSREFATQPATRAMSNFWSGVIIYNQAMAIDAQNAAQAQRALPLFQQALEFFNQSGPYTDQPNTPNANQFIQSTQSGIEYAEALIQRGR